MKLKKVSELDYVEVVEGRVVKKTDLILLPYSSSGIGACRMGLVKSGKYVGEICMYRAHTEQRFDTGSAKVVVIPSNAIISLVELDDNERFSHASEFDEAVNGVEDDWIHAK
jgi:hypothetical protein